MDLKIIITYDLSVDDEIDLDALTQEIEDENFLEAWSVDEIIPVDSVHIAQKEYLIKADGEVKIGKIDKL